MRKKENNFKGIYVHFTKGKLRVKKKQEAQILKNRNKGEGIVKTT